MPDLIIYLLKVNVALLLFYLAYHVALRRLTFYHLNRLFLLFGILFSTLYPLIDLSEFFSQHQKISNTYLINIPTWTAAPAVQAQAAVFDYWLLPVFLFWIGAAIMAIRLLMQFISLYKIHAASKPKNFNGIRFREINQLTQAFSFWQTIYLNPSQHQQEELESILRHEQIHVKGWHTLDVLLTEISTVFYWFNPGIWLMKNAIKENLEFIADQIVVNSGVDKKEYQYLLLKVVGATQPQIANQFNFPSLKRRIAMMNKMPDHKASKLRLLIVLPLATVLLLAFRSAATETEALVSASETVMQQQNNDKILPKELVEHLKKNPAIKTVRGRVIDNRNAVVINLKGGGTEVYYLNDEASIAELEKKYGLPELPPPPPPVLDVPELPAPPPPAPAVQGAAELPAPPAPEQLKVNLPDGPVYYIDGKEDKSDAYKTLDPKQIHSINVYKGESAEKVFGKSAPKGVVSIVTKQNKDSRQVQEFNKKFPTPPAPPAPGTPPPTPPAPPADEHLPAPPPPIQDNTPVYIPSTSDQHDDHKAFLKRNPEVKEVGWIMREHDKKNSRLIVLYLKGGNNEIYDLDNKGSIASAEKKYGELPSLPPPPPPIRRSN
jgi:hypothetical protein